MSVLTSEDLAAAIVLMEEDTRSMRSERARAKGDPEFIARYDVHIARNEARVARLRDALGEVVASELRSRPRA